LSIVSIAGV